jgi:hypothetical protein
VSAEFAGETDAAKIFARLTEELARALEAAAEVLEHGD